MTFENLHPFEMAICGDSGSGKTTLIASIIKELSSDYTTAYFKEASHSFHMDRKGKDTWMAKEAGGERIAITSPGEIALLGKNPQDPLLLKDHLLHADILFIEGLREKADILVFSGSERDRFFLKGDTRHLLAITGKKRPSPCPLPFFHRDDITGICRFIKSIWQKKISQIPLMGLLLAGGQSKRMGKDKATLSYRALPQARHYFNLLEEICDKVYLSRSPGQTDIPDLPVIEDRHHGFGPVGGILSAFHRHRHAAWMIVACDMPFIDNKSIGELREKRNPFRLATCFFNPEKKWPEPLLAIYEMKAFHKLGSSLFNGITCPRKILSSSPIKQLDPVDPAILKNINTPDEYHHACAIIQGGHP